MPKERVYGQAKNITIFHITEHFLLNALVCLLWNLITWCLFLSTSGNGMNYQYCHWFNSLILNICSILLWSNQVNDSYHVHCFSSYHSQNNTNNSKSRILKQVCIFGTNIFWGSAGMEQNFFHFSINLKLFSLVRIWFRQSSDSSAFKVWTRRGIMVKYSLKCF